MIYNYIHMCMFFHILIILNRYIYIYIVTEILYIVMLCFYNLVIVNCVF